MRAAFRCFRTVFPKATWTLLALGTRECLQFGGLWVYRLSVQVGDGQRVGGEARDDAQGFDQVGGGGDLFAAHHAVQQGGGEVAGGVGVGGDGGEGRVGEVAKELVVVDA